MTRICIESMTATHAERLDETLVQARSERLSCTPWRPPAAWPEPGEGSVAVDPEGRILAFACARCQDDPIWGPALVLNPDAWGLAADVPPDILGRLYAREWERLGGCLDAHYVYASAFDSHALDAWFHLGFGLEQAYGTALLDRMQVADPCSEIEIVKAGPGDEDLLESLSGLIAQMQSQAPVWSGAPEAYPAELREGFRGLATDSEAIAVLVAMDQGRAVGHQVWFPRAPDAVEGPVAGAAELVVTAVVPEARGLGIGNAMTRAGIRAAQAAGYTRCFTDWRTTNPLSSAFWRDRGLEPYRYRLARRLEYRFMISVPSR